MCGSIIIEILISVHLSMTTRQRNTISKVQSWWNIVSKIYSSKFLNFSDHSSYKEINNPSFEPDKEIDESAVRPYLALRKFNQLQQDINILLQKRIKKRSWKLIVNMRKRQKNSVVELDARAIQAQ